MSDYGKWISDQKPSQNGKYLVLWGTDQYEVREWKDNKWVPNIPEGIASRIVTHWTELPPLPKK